VRDGGEGEVVQHEEVEGRIAEEEREAEEEDEDVEDGPECGCWAGDGDEG